MYNSPYFLINSPSPTELGKWDGGMGGKNIQLKHWPCQC